MKSCDFQNMPDKHKFTYIFTKYPTFRKKQKSANENLQLLAAWFIFNNKTDGLELYLTKSIFNILTSL